MSDLLTFFDQDIILTLAEDITVLEVAEGLGKRQECAQLLIDKYRIMAVILDEYRNRNMSAAGLMVEWRNRMIAMREEQNEG